MRMALGAGTKRVARELLAESLLLGLIGGALRRRARLRAAFGCSSTCSPRGCRGWRRSRSIRSCLLFTLALSLAAGLLFGVMPVLKYARPQSRQRAQGQRPRIERRPRAPSRPQHARRRAGGARGRAARRVGSDDSHVSRHARRLAGIRPAGRRADAAHHDSKRRHRRSSAGRAHARANRAAHRGDRRRRVRRASPRRSRWTASAATTRSSSRTFPRLTGRCRRSAASSGSASGYFETMGNPVVAGRAITWADVHNASAGRDGQRELRARVLGRAGQGRRPAHPATRRRIRGARSSASSATSARKASPRPRRPSSIGR